MNCFESLLKYILYVFNVIFVICGILIIAVGAIMLKDLGNIRSITQAFQTNMIPIIVITLGSVIFLIAFCGCCGTRFENLCCLSIYATLMFIIFCLQSVLIVWMFIKHEDVLSAMEDFVNEQWRKNDHAHGYPMDAMQLSFDCCGQNDYMDYVALNKSVPNSCCGKVSVNNKCPQFIYEKKQGCRLKFRDFWSNNISLIRWGGIVVAIIEMIAIWFACCVISGIRQGSFYDYDDDERSY